MSRPITAFAPAEYFGDGVRPSAEPFTPRQATSNEAGYALEGGGLILCVSPEALASTNALPEAGCTRFDSETKPAISCVFSVFAGLVGWALLVCLTCSISQLR